MTPKEWKEVKLKDVCIQITDGVHNTVRDDINGECYLLSCKNIKNGHIEIGNNERRINYETLLNLRKRTRTEKGDVLLTSVGTIGETAVIKDDNPIYEFQRSVAILKPNQSIITPNFLYYSLNNKKLHLQNSAEGAVQQCLFINPLKEFVIKIPTLDIQKKIAAILSTIDDKIELNNKINVNLEQQAQAIFKSWFVDFEPFGGIMPNDWEVKTLDELCNIFTGRKNANQFVEKGKFKFFTCGPKILNIDSYIFDGPAVIIAGNGAYTGRTSFYNGKFDLYQRTYACTIKDQNLENYIYLLYVIIKNELSKKIMGGTHGSAIPYIVMNDLAKFEFSYNKKYYDKISAIIKPIILKILENISENERLSQIRDAILPKLMSGEIDVDKMDVK